MDTEWLKIALTVFNMLVTFGVGIFAWQVRRQQITAASIAEMDRRLTQSIVDQGKEISAKLEKKHERISTLERDIGNLPTKSDIVRLHERMDCMLKDSKEMMLMLGDIAGQVKQAFKGQQ